MDMMYETHIYYYNGGRNSSIFEIIQLHLLLQISLLFQSEKISQYLFLFLFLIAFWTDNDVF